MEKLKNRSEIGIYALGGLGEVGANMYVIDYLEQLFVIDCGVLFPDEHLLGVDYVIPDFSYLKKNEHKIVGLFITHGHEDHIGGIPFLLKQVKIPCIYAAGVTVDLIQNKLQDYPELLSVTKFKEFNNSSTYTFKDVTVSFIRLNHSIPDMFGIVFDTPLGKIFHTGDFKFDLTPVGPPAEYEKLAKLGEEGCLCMLADSTNALRDGFTLSERKIGYTIKELFQEIKDRIIVATFASNMFRVQQVIEACVEHGRHIAIFGRSMEKTIEVGQQVGYIKAPKGTIIDASEIDKYKPNEVCLLCTGSQGEPMAALSRIANGSHKTIKLIPSDTIIFSSNPIPGNQEGVNRTINLLFKKGANVIINSPINDTHTTGHASQGELKLMLTLVKPKYFMPIHGEYRMQRVHGDLAIQTGVDPKNVFVLENGDVLAINERTARVAGHVPASEVYVDGSGIGDVSGNIIKERKMLADDGMFSLIITIDSKKKTVPLDPQVVSRGFIFMKDSEELTKYFVDKAKEYLLGELENMKMVNLLQLKKGLTEELSNIIYKKTDRKPMVIPVFMDIAGK
jgi:ribonuclease J